MDSIKWNSQHGNHMTNSMTMFQTDPRTEEPKPGSCTAKVTNESKQNNQTYDIDFSLYNDRIAKSKKITVRLTFFIQALLNYK